MKQATHDSKKRIAFPIKLFSESDDAVEIPSEIHVIPTGEWDHPYYGLMKITSADIAEFVQNFKDQVRLDIRITAGHDNGMSGGELPAIGWFTDLIDRGVNGLYATVEWTEEGKKLLTDKAYKYFSPEFYEQYEDPESRRVYNHVVVGGALTNSPYFKELSPVVFSEPGEPLVFNIFSNSMDLKTILAKKAEDLSADEKAFLVDHKDELTDDQKTSFATVVGEGETPEQKQAREEKEKGDTNEAAGLNRDGTEKVSASEKGKTVAISTAELAELRKNADKGFQAFTELAGMKAEKKAEALIFSESNKDGHFLPKQKDALTKFMGSLSDAQRNEFTALVNNLPKVKLFGEVGDSGRTESDVVTEVEKAVKAKMSEANLPYAKALSKVFQENPDLRKRYENEVAPATE